MTNQSCAACGEPVTARQQSVTYQGENLDVPDGTSAVFHARLWCHWHARDYEVRWLAADPSRRSPVEWLSCLGKAIVHVDGTSECAEPGCPGWEHRDHREGWVCLAMPGGCQRGCPDVYSPKMPKLTRRYTRMVRVDGGGAP